MGRDMKNIQRPKTLFVDPAIHKRLKLLAAERDTSVKELVEAFVQAGLEQAEQQKAA